jgi:hypothetical protein
MDLYIAIPRAPQAYTQNHRLDGIQNSSFMRESVFFYERIQIAESGIGGVLPLASNQRQQSLCVTAFAPTWNKPPELRH